jgi:hypothetical protein
MTCDFERKSRAHVISRISTPNGTQLRVQQKSVQRVREGRRSFTGHEKTDRPFGMNDDLSEGGASPATGSPEFSGASGLNPRNLFGARKNKSKNEP